MPSLSHTAGRRAHATRPPSVPGRLVEASSPSRARVGTSGVRFLGMLPDGPDSEADPDPVPPGASSRTPTTLALSGAVLFAALEAEPTSLEPGTALGQ